MSILRITALLLSGILLLTGCGSAAQAANTESPASGKEAAAEEKDVPQKDAEKAEAGTGETDNSEITATESVYPEPAGNGMDAETFMMDDSYWDWLQSCEEKTELSMEKQEGMDQYYEAVLGELLGGESDANLVCSPLNIYMAFSMLAETTGENTRKQILDLLQAEDIELLRDRVQALWDANYLDTPMVKSQLANSMWLRNDIGYHDDTLKRLAEVYHASSYSGEMGTDGMNSMLRKWTDEHTGGLLSEYTKDMELNRETVLALVSAVYYKAAWNNRFQAERTDTAVFHGKAGDRQVSMMHLDEMMNYCKTDRFQAVSLELQDSGSMYFVLPNEGTDLKEIVKDPETIKLFRNPHEMDIDQPMVHLSVPKFKVSDKADLIDHLKSLGITDVTNPFTADFSPLTDEAERMRLSAAEHAAMVEIDEEGVTGAAYTELVVDALGMMMPPEEVEFVLDRPFYFAVTGRDGSIIFAGLVQNIDQ